mgnify:CR=1 FL=1
MKMDYTFAIELKKGLLKEYEKEILLSNEMDFFVPMGIVEKEDTDRFVYDYTGLVPLSGLSGPLGVKSVLDILERTILCLIVAEDYLLEVKNIALSCSTVYLNPITRQIRLLYLPTKGEANCVLGGLSIFAKELSAKYVSGIAAEYLAALESFMNNNISLVALANKIGAMRREAFLCGMQ